MKLNVHRRRGLAGYPFPWVIMLVDDVRISTIAEAPDWPAALRFAWSVADGKTPLLTPDGVRLNRDRHLREIVEDVNSAAYARLRALK